jgi:hypothetical protein
MDTTKDTARSGSASRGVVISCDYRADMKNGKIGMVLESPGSSIGLRAIYATPNIIAFDKSDKPASREADDGDTPAARTAGDHRIEGIDAIYIKLGSFGDTIILQRNGTITRISMTASIHPITENKLHPGELEKLSLEDIEVGKPMPKGLALGSGEIKCIVAVSSSTYNDREVERMTHGKKVGFVSAAETLMKNEADWAGRD